MVFHSVSKEEEGEQISSVAMSSSNSVKSQPLHNFTLSGLKWTVNSSHNHRVRKFAGSAHRDSEGLVRSSAPTTAIDSDSDHLGLGKSAVKDAGVVENPPKKLAVSGSGTRSDHPVKVSEVSVQNVEEPLKDRGPKVFVRLRTSKNKQDTPLAPSPTPAPSAESGDQALAEAMAASKDADELRPKTWNLRPRKSMRKKSSTIANGQGEAPQIGGLIQDTKSKDQKRPEPIKEKIEFSVSLSKEEIEQDFLALTGSKPARRPRKRARNVQKHLDNVFPGLWLDSITPGDYQVADTPAKLIR